MTTPADAAAIYAFSLRQIRTGPGRELIEVRDPDTGEPALTRAWTAAYRPLLEALVAAAEPLTMTQLTCICGEPVVEAVMRLSQFLERIDDSYRFYHSTLGEFLTADATRGDPNTAELFVDPARAHQRLASRIEADAELWKDSGDPVREAFRRYARRYRMYHLLHAGRPDMMFRVLDDRSHGRQQLRVDPSGSELHADVCLTITAVSAVADDDERLARAWRYHLLHTTVTGHAATHSLDGYAVIAITQGADSLRKVIGLITHPLRRSTLLAEAAILCANIDADVGAALAAAAVDVAGYLAQIDARRAVLPKLLTAWHAVAASGRRPTRVAADDLVTLGLEKPVDNAAVRLIDAMLANRRPISDTLAVLDLISDPRLRLKPLAWCSAYLSRTGDADTARPLMEEAAAR